MFASLILFYLSNSSSSSSCIDREIEMIVLLWLLFLLTISLGWKGKNNKIDDDGQSKAESDAPGWTLFGFDVDDDERTEFVCL